MRLFPPLLAAATLLAGCGGAAPDRAGREVKLGLSGTPGAVHAGIYLAVQRGFDSAEGVTLHPEATRDPVRELTSAQDALVVLDIHDLAVARQRGKDVVGVMAIVERPVTALRPARYRRATRRTPGAPEYPELVLATLRSTLTDDPATVRGTVAALQRGYREAYVDPESAVQAVTGQVRGLKTAAVSAELDRLGPAFLGTLPTFGALDSARLRAWAAWEARTGIVKRPPDAARAFDGRYVKKG
jgi:ABC-type nitrate/sulfonate/bicarbonate transport system substrate-binding protein